MSSIENYDAIDFAKIIASILVICIHIHPLKDISPVVAYILDNGIARMAVPFFFTTSAFLLFKKINLLNNNKDKVNILNKYLRRITILYLVWSMVYFPFTYINWISNDISISKDLILYIREILFLGTYGHLWYFPALIFSICIVYFLQRRVRKKVLVIISIIIYILGIIYNFYPYIEKLSFVWINNLYLIYKSVFITSRNGLFFGIIFVTIGYLHSQDNKIKSKKIYLILTVLSIILLIAESLLVKKITGNGSDMYIMLVPCIYFGFILLLEFKYKANKLLSGLLRNISTIMYTSQFLFIQFFNMLEITYKLNSLIKFIFIVIIIIFISIFIIKCSEKKKLKILRYLY